MKANFERCLAETLRHEGGWSDHPSDPGGATMKGVTIGTFARYKKREVSKAELKAISDHDLQTIYRKEYWDKVRGDDLPAGLDLVAFDGAVNSGPSRGAKWVQQGLGVKADGKIGPVTIDRARAVSPRSAVEAACIARMTFLRGLSTWPTFGKGWARRVAEVREDALAMIAAPPLATKPVVVQEPPQSETQTPAPKPAPPVASAPVAASPGPEKAESLLVRFLRWLARFITGGKA